MGIKVDFIKCTGCKLCVGACKQNAISMINDKAIVFYEKCTLCGDCVDICSEKAITVTKDDTSEAANLSQYKNVAAFIEQRENEICPVSYEMLGEGRKLADQLGEKLYAILLGNSLKEKAEELINYGADKVFYFDGPDLETFKDETYTAVVSDFIDAEKPSILLAGGTTIGRSFIPKVAARVRGGLAADCIKLEIDTDKRILLATRPTLGGNLFVTVICPNKRPQIATVRHKVMAPSELDENRTGELVVKTIEAGSIPERTKILDIVKEVESTINLTEADIIVSGGRGMQNPDNFKYIRELAEILGAAVGSSRAAVDAGWMPYSHQVGQTGKTVNPKLYIACGISGAVQHQAGMKSSDYIIAINKDPDADIFNIANLGIVGDALRVLPELSKTFKQKLGR